ADLRLGHSKDSRHLRRRYRWRRPSRAGIAGRSEYVSCLCPLALVLSRDVEASPSTASLKMALLETQDLSKAHRWTAPDDQYSNRASSLTPSSIGFLDSIGAWKHVDLSRVQSYDE